MTMPDARRFSALARSSPWRWRTVRFIARWTPRSQLPRQPVRAWVRRPDALRVETLDGALVRAFRSDDLSGRSSLAWLQPAGGRGLPPPEPRGPLHPDAPAPALDEDGLVARRPPETPELRYDDPMYQDYFWVAMLDPVELADGEGRLVGDPERGAVRLDDVREAEHHGRAAWQALARPTASYDPRCSCCALLVSAASEAREAEALGRPVPGRDPDVRFAEAHRVRLDVGTGICVLTEELGGSRPGAGHDLRIEAVDESMSDDLFPEFPDRRRRLPWRRALASAVLVPLGNEGRGRSRPPGPPRR